MRRTLQPLLLDRTPRYREAAYAAIKDAILSRQFDPSEALVEEKIAAALTISRTPVREALAILEHEQLIAPRNGRGLYVRELAREEFVALFVANEAVEPTMARRAALRAAPEQLDAMREAIGRAEHSVVNRDSVAFLRASRDFHRLVGEASGNVPLTAFVLSNEERADMYLLSANKVVDTASMDASNREHAAILAAISQRDPEAAARLAIYHAQSLRERFADLFRPNKEDVVLGTAAD
ncbi:MAG: GntR family transcriptional regulator [Chloroflexales bacterium]|nr:GntR family transcriptional regulator [Chloroflexales bacterium]